MGLQADWGVPHWRGGGLRHVLSHGAPRHWQPPLPGTETGAGPSHPLAGETPPSLSFPAAVGTPLYRPRALALFARWVWANRARPSRPLHKHSSRGGLAPVSPPCPPPGPSRGDSAQQDQGRVIPCVGGDRMMAGKALAPCRPPRTRTGRWAPRTSCFTPTSPNLCPAPWGYPGRGAWGGTRPPMGSPPRPQGLASAQSC